MTQVFLIADLHLGHNNIHEKWRKQFSSELEHDLHIVDEWNSVVKKNDVVKVLGDFFFSSAYYVKLIHKLHGQIHWILGNHDPKITREILDTYKNISYCAGTVPYKDGCVLSHVPIHPDEFQYRWTWNIHGHIHNPDVSPNVRDDKRYYNVNADVIGFKPKLYTDILGEMDGRFNI